MKMLLIVATKDGKKVRATIDLPVEEIIESVIKDIEKNLEDEDIDIEEEKEVNFDCLVKNRVNDVKHVKKIPIVLNNTLKSLYADLVELEHKQDFRVLVEAESTRSIAVICVDLS